MLKNFKKLISAAAAAAVLLTSLTAVNVFAASELKCEVFIEPQYEAAQIFWGELAPVKKDGKWGFINKSNEFVIAPKYDYASIFSEGRALVGNARMSEYDYVEYVMMLVDETGREYPLKMMDGSPATVGDAQLLFDETGTPIGHYLYNGYIQIQLFTGPAETKIFDSNGDELDIYVTEYEYLTGLYSDGLIGFTREPSQTYTISYYDINKNPVLRLPSVVEIPEHIEPCTHPSGYIFVNDGWDHAYEFVGGYALAEVVPADKADDWYAGTYDTHPVLIDKEGNIVFDGVEYNRFTYQGIVADKGVRPYADGLLTLGREDNGKWGAVDINNNVKVPFEYDAVYPAREGLLLVKKDGLWGYVDVNGNTAIEPQYDSATPFGNGFAMVSSNGEVMVIDRFNNPIPGGESIPLDYYIKDDGDGIPGISAMSEIIIVEENGKYGYAEIVNETMPEKVEMSEWAYDEVVDAIENEIVPNHMRNNYFSVITRLGFAEIVVNALEEAVGMDPVMYYINKNYPGQYSEYRIEYSSSTTPAENDGSGCLVIYNPFKDISDENVIKAHFMGIINGIAADEFSPYKEITRQDAAAMLMRAAKVVAGDITASEKAFNDGGMIAEYAKEAVNYVTELNIMNGIGGGNFGPLATYTREQAYITCMRLLTALKN